jgi:hypothetical protein
MDDTTLRLKMARQGVLFIFSLSLLICGGSVYGLWRLAKPLSLEEVRAWAITITLALPVVAVAAFLFGRREASVMTDGIRTGVNEVADMADQITEIKGKTASQLRQPPVTVQVAAGAALPSPQMYHRRIEGESERVDL